ncbi:hypothetical protein [Nocardioides ungokensis]|uniref:hypothetical protein n=1 Tax=Nocardioides ungokensis TaxID=1643322 RepID=UPI0015E03421|nr:hypothetical protein [Nocardioides ungokensis]
MSRRTTATLLALVLLIAGVVGETVWSRRRNPGEVDLTAGRTPAGARHRSAGRWTEPPTAPGPRPARWPGAPS